MIPSKPSSALSSILGQGSSSQHQSLKTILKDVQEHNADMSKSDQMRTAKTIKQLNTDPNSVVSKKLKKQAFGALKNAGHLRHKFHKNYGAAIKEINRQDTIHDKKTLSEIKKLKPSELSKEERKRLKVFKNKMRARAADEREEVEGSFHTQDHDTTKFGLEEWQDASVSANSNQRQREYKLQDKEKKNSSQSKPPIVDMMID